MSIRLGCPRDLASRLHWYTLVRACLLVYPLLPPRLKICMQAYKVCAYMVRLTKVIEEIGGVYHLRDFLHPTLVDASAADIWRETRCKLRRQVMGLIPLAVEFASKFDDNIISAAERVKYKFSNSEPLSKA